MRISRKKYLKILIGAAGGLMVGGAYYILKTKPAIKGKTTWLHNGWSEDTASKIIQSFQKENPNITVEYSTIPPEDYFSNLETAFKSGDVPYDIIYAGSSPPSYYYEYMDEGWLLSIDEYTPKSLLDDLLEPAKDAITYDGHIYGLPWYNELGMVLMYNKQMLEKAGITEPAKTWDEVTQHCVTIKNTGICKYPLGISLMEHFWETYQHVLYSWGGKFYDDQGNCLYNSDLSLEVLKWILDIIYKQSIVIFTDHGELELLCAGTRAYSLNFYHCMAIANDPNKSKVAGYIDTCPMPGREGLTGGSLSFFPLWVVPTQCRNLDVTIEFLKYLGGPPGHKLWAIEKGLYPAYRSVVEDPEVQHTPSMKGCYVWLKQRNVFLLGKNYCGPEIPIFTDFRDKAQIEILNALTRKKGPKEALDAVVEDYYELTRE